jgi:hypothetical protein
VKDTNACHCGGAKFCRSKQCRACDFAERAASSAARSALVCRNCHAHKANRPRGLCWTCYYTPGVRESQPTRSKYAPGGGDFSGDAPPPATRTPWEPGSRFKVAALALRAALKQSLWNARDVAFDLR